MLDAMPVYQPAAVRLRESRRVSRVRGDLRARTGLSRARIEATADLQALKADVLTYVARRAMQDVAMLSQLEQQLATLVPMASGRLATIGDAASLALAELVSDTLHELR